MEVEVGVKGKCVEILIFCLHPYKRKGIISKNYYGDSAPYRDQWGAEVLDTGGSRQIPSISK
jgi:hypothetical protein